MITYTFCEPVQALLEFMPIHIRELKEGEGRLLGGYTSAQVCPTMCHRIPYYGWDLEGDVTEESVARTLDAEVHPLCSTCARKWREAQPGYVAPPPPKIEGARPMMVVIDEAADVGF